MVRSSCPQCHKALCNQYSVARHVLQCHLKVRRFICSICHKGLSSKQYLLMHLEKHERLDVRTEKKESLITLSLPNAELGPDEGVVKTDMELPLNHEFQEPKENQGGGLSFFKLGSFTEPVEIKEERGCSGEFIRLPPISRKFISQDTALPSVFWNPGNFGSI